MCNRYSIENPDSVEKWIREKVGAEFLEVIGKSGIKFTASPTNLLPVVFNQNDGRIVTLMKWGIRFDGEPRLYTNAKKERALSLWKNLVQNRRCLVPADGFFEWPAVPPKTPWMFRRAGNTPFAFAGIFTEAETFAFLTTEPNSLTRSMGHLRSPVVLTENNVSAWLKPGELTRDDIEAIAAPSDGDFTKHRVTMRMNRTGYNVADAVVPLSADEILAETKPSKIVRAEREDGTQLSLL